MLSLPSPHGVNMKLGLRGDIETHSNFSHPSLWVCSWRWRNIKNAQSLHFERILSWLIEIYDMKCMLVVSASKKENNATIYAASNLSPCQGLSHRLVLRVMRECHDSCVSSFSTLALEWLIVSVAFHPELLLLRLDKNHTKSLLDSLAALFNPSCPLEWIKKRWSTQHLNLKG